MGTRGGERRYRPPPPIVIEALHRLDECGLESIEPSRPLRLLALDLAERHGLSMDDAAYVALAESASAPLLTGDAHLLAATTTNAIALDADDHELAERRVAYERSSTWPLHREASAFLARLRGNATRGVTSRA